MWSQPCAHVIFDTDPSPRGGHEAAKPEEMCQAMIRLANHVHAQNLTSKKTFIPWP
jgi:hypothetical protein